MMNWHDGMSGWGYGLMTVSMVLLWGLLILAAIAVFRYLSRSEQRPVSPPRSRSDAEDVLAERFARGEIDTEEYEQRLTVLRGTARSPSGR